MDRDETDTIIRSKTTNSTPGWEWGNNKTPNFSASLLFSFYHSPGIFPSRWWSMILNCFLINAVAPTPYQITWMKEQILCHTVILTYYKWYRMYACSNRYSNTLRISLYSCAVNKTPLKPLGEWDHPVYRHYSNAESHTGTAYFFCRAVIILKNRGYSNTM